MFSQGVVTTAPPYSHLRPGSQSGHRVTRVFHSSVTGHILENGEGSGHGHKCNFTLSRAEERHTIYGGRGGGGAGGVCRLRAHGIPGRRVIDSGIL